MKKISLLMSALCLVLLANCHAKSKSKKTASDQPQTTSTTGETNVKYRLVVSFISKGSGIDGPKYDAIESYIKKHPKQPVMDIIQKGREGERELALELKELTKSEQSAFVDEIKKLAQGSDRVVITENTDRVKKQ